MLGIDASGKTTLLYQMRLSEVVSTIPTIGFNVENISHQGYTLTIWDVGGQDKIRLLWAHYYSNTNVLVYVIDSIDKERFEGRIH